MLLINEQIEKPISCCSSSRKRITLLKKPADDSANFLLYVYMCIYTHKQVNIKAHNFENEPNFFRSFNYPA